MKTCTRCKKELPNSSFGQSKRKSRLGRKEHLEIKSHCRSCIKIDAKEYRIKNHDKLILSQKEYRNKYGPELIEKQRLSRLTFPERQKTAQRKHNLKVKVEVLSHYSNGLLKCSCCNEPILDFLTIDHINGNGSSHRRTITGSFYEWLKKKEFPEGYQVLCYNCNCGKRISGICPHETHKKIMEVEHEKEKL